MPFSNYLDSDAKPLHQWSSLLRYFSSFPAPHFSLLPDARCAIPSSYHHHHHHRSQLYSFQATSYACKHPSANCSIYDRPSFDRTSDNWSFHKPQIHDRSSHDRLEHWNPSLRVNSENPNYMLDQEEVLHSTQQNTRKLILIHLNNLILKKDMFFDTHSETLI